MSGPSIHFEVRCSSCQYFELWSLERAVRELVVARKLSPESEFDVILFAELFRVHAKALSCPDCRKRGTLSAKTVEPGQWDWEDAVRCEDCGREIPDARLQAVPGATRCVRCQEEFERDS